VAAGISWLERHRAALRELLTGYGCLLLRGLPIATAEDFAAARDALLDSRVPYREKATPRSDYGNGVFSSTDLPAAQSIALHNENSYTLEFPGVLLFGCLVAPTTGGCTTVADVRRVLAEIPAPIVRRFRDRGWLLVRNYADHVGLPWQAAFGTSDRAEVEAYCAAHEIGLSWTEDDRLRTGQVRSAIVRHPVTGEEVWFNHLAFWNLWSLDAEVREVMVDSFGADGFPFATYDGHGAPVSHADLDAIRAAYDRATLREPWQAGDLLLVDNVLCAHGRDPFSGPRRIVVAMGEPVMLRQCRPVCAPRPFPPEDLVAEPAGEPGSEVAADALQGSMEHLIAGYWTELLGVPVVRPGDDFFALGGHSLLAMQVVHRLREQTGLAIPVRLFFDTPVLRKVAAAVTHWAESAPSGGAPLDIREARR
jgi:hypothetical protein